MQKCFDCGKIYFGDSRFCPKCGADQWEGKYGDCSRYSLQNTLKSMDTDEEDVEEYIFIAELIVKKLRDEETYDDFGWKAVDSLIRIYTTDPEHTDFQKALDLCKLYGKCIHADFGDDAKTAAEERANEIYAMPDCPFKPEPKQDMLTTLMAKLVKDLKGLDSSAEFDFLGRTVSRNDFTRALVNFSKYCRGEIELAAAPKFMYYIGKAYELGSPFKCNTKCARAWYKEAAKRGSKEAKNIVG